MDISNNKIELIKRLFNQGINDFVPVMPDSKRPLEGRKNWNIDTLNHQEMISHLVINPTHNYGIVTNPSNLVVIDIDGLEGLNSIKDILGDKWEDEINSYIVKTGNGYHIYCSVPENFKHTNKIKILPGIDIISNTQVIGAGSIHKNGNEYEVIKDSNICSVPSWVTALIPEEIKPKKEIKKTITYKKKRPKRTYKNINIDDLLNEIEDIPQGYRDDKIFRLACSLRNKGCTKKDLLEILAAVNKNKCIPPMKDEEVIKKVNSALRYDDCEDVKYTVINRIKVPVVIPVNVLEWFFTLESKEQHKAFALFSHMYTVSTWGTDYDEIAHYTDFFSKKLGVTRKTLKPLLNKFAKKGLFKLRKERLKRSEGKNFDTVFFTFTPDGFKS